LTVASPNWNKLTVIASVFRGVEACATTWLVDDTAKNWAEEVVVGLVASISCWVVGLGAAVENATLFNDWLWDWSSNSEGGEGSENEGEVLHFGVEGWVGKFKSKLSVD